VRCLVQAGVRLFPVPSWDAACRTASGMEGGGLLLLCLDAMEQTLNPPTGDRTFPSGRQPVSPPGGWYVIGVWRGQTLDPPSVQQMLTWGLSEILPTQDLADRTVARRLLNRACFGRFGQMIVEELERGVDSQMLHLVARVMDATLSTIADGSVSPAVVARRLHMSRSTLDRSVRRAGLVPPSALAQRTRLILALLLRTIPAKQTTASKDLGFYSPGHLSTRIREHLGVTLRELDRMDPSRRLEKLVGTLKRPLSRGKDM